MVARFYAGAATGIVDFVGRATPWWWGRTSSSRRRRRKTTRKKRRQGAAEPPQCVDDDRPPSPGGPGPPPSQLQRSPAAAAAGRSATRSGQKEIRLYKSVGRPRGCSGAVRAIRCRSRAAAPPAGLSLITTELFWTIESVPVPFPMLPSCDHLAVVFPGDPAAARRLRLSRTWEMSVFPRDHARVIAADLLIHFRQQMAALSRSPAETASRRDEPPALQKCPLCRFSGPVAPSWTADSMHF